MTRVGRFPVAPKAWRLLRFGADVITIALALAAAAEAWLVTDAARHGVTTAVGLDVNQYLAHASRWLSGGSWYVPAQLAGSYSVERVGGNVYPPTLLYLVVPFAVGWLPMALWWALPLGAMAIGFARHRPAWWGTPLLALALCLPRTWTILLLGNPAMWSIAFAVWGAWLGWPAWGATLKATLAPLAFLGCRRRRAFLGGLAGAVLLSLPFGSLWLDYVRVLLNASSDRGPEYLLGELPTALLLAAAAWSAPARSGLPPKSPADGLAWAARHLASQRRGTAGGADPMAVRTPEFP